MSPNYIINLYLIQGIVFEEGDFLYCKRMLADIEKNIPNLPVCSQSG